MLIELMGGPGLFCLELTFFWEINGPILMSWAPKVSFVIDSLGVFLSVFWILLLPLLFPFAITRLCSSLFMTLALAFYFDFSFARGRGLKALG